jgi:hypothetical protein
MKTRSPQKVFLLSVLTLGIYDLVWLSQTRRELTKLTNVRIPSIKLLAILNILQLAGFVIFIICVVGINTNNKSIPVTSECWSQWALGNAPETKATNPVSKTCQEQVDRSNAASDRQSKFIKGFEVAVGLLLLSRLGYPRWLRNYGLAVQQITAGKFSQTTTMSLLLFGSAYGMSYIQSEFNTITNPALVTAQMPLPKSTENKTAHKILSIIALTMAILFGLVILFLIMVSYIGTHH